MLANIDIYRYDKSLSEGSFMLARALVTLDLQTREVWLLLADPDANRWTVCGPNPSDVFGDWLNQGRLRSVGEIDAEFVVPRS